MGTKLGSKDSITNYVATTSQNLGLDYKSLGTLYYVDDAKEPYGILGIHDYTVGFISRTLSFSGYTILIDSKESGFYKHELTHYVIRNNRTIPFFNEGIASFFGGSSLKSSSEKDYKFLNEFLSAHQKEDSVMYRILNKQMVENVQYGFAYYQLGSFTVYLLEKKYGKDAIREQVFGKRNAITSNNAGDIIKYLCKKFNTSEKKLTSFYISNLRSYLTNKSS